jgi:16S rRNA processing protein RimM
MKPGFLIKGRVDSRGGIIYEISNCQFKIIQIKLSNFLTSIPYFCKHMQFIGKITGIHGLKGEVTFSHHLKKNTRFNTWDCLMIELNPGSYIPFFIETIRNIATDECICKLQEINTRDEAKLILNKLIYASKNYQIESIKTNNLQQYIGYKVWNGEDEIGEIIEAIENNINNMFLVHYKGKEVLLPSQHDLIESIDVKSKIIFMKLPEGLLEL